jgi:site-specific recombinase XerD
VTLYEKSGNELTARDMYRIIDSFTSSTVGVRNSTMLSVMWRTGLKMNEALSLTVENIDIANCRLEVGRSVPIDDDLLCLLRAWVRMRPAGAEVVFCTTSGKKMSDRSVRTIMTRAAYRAGIGKPAYPTALRYLFARDMEQAGKKLSEIAELMGHKSTRTTAAYLR